MPQIVVGTLRVDLVANTKTFTPGMDEAARKAKEGSKKINEEFAEVDFHEARGALALLGEDIGLHLPRHVRSFLAELPGVSTALASAFTGVAIISLGIALFEAYEKLSKMAEKAREAKEQMEELNIKILSQGNALMLTTLKIDDQIRALRGIPAQNSLTIALIEATKRAQDLWAALDADEKKAKQTLEQMNVNWFGSMWKDKESTTEDLGKYTKALDDLSKVRRQNQREAQEVQEALGGMLRHGTEAERANAREVLKVYQESWAERDRVALEGARKVGNDTLKEMDDYANKFDERNKKGHTMFELSTRQVKEQQGARREMHDAYMDQLHSESYAEEQVNEVVKDNINLSETQKKEVIDLSGLLHKKSVIQPRIDRLAKEQKDADDAAANALMRINWELLKEDQIRDALLTKEMQAREQTARAAEQLKDAEAEYNLQLREAKGLISERTAAEERLKTYEEAKTREMTRQKDLLNTLAKRRDFYSGLTMGGQTGSRENQELYKQSVVDFEKAQRDMYAIQIHYDGKITAAQAQLDNTFKSHLNKWAEAATGKDAIFKKLGSTFTDTIDNMSSTLTKFLVEGQADWKGFATAAIESFVQIGTHALIVAATMKLLKALGVDVDDNVDKKKEANVEIAKSDAGVAAANTFAYYSATLQLPIAAAMSGLAYGIGMLWAGASHEKGGLIPNTGLTLVHKGEGVFPAPVTNALMRVAQDNLAFQPQDRRSANVTYAPQFSLWDKSGVSTALEKHRDVVRGMVRREIGRL